ncbi:hypothetical protein ACLBXM_09315 [Xanthobacteraceae bacterium A53D]
MSHANDNTPWTAEKRAASAAITAPARKRIAEAQAAEASTVSRITKRIAKRQSIGDGWDGKAANDNIGWPLAKALLAAGDGELLKYAMRYRQIETSATSEVLLGGTSIGADPVQVDQKTWVKPDGTVAYKGERQLTAAKFVGDIPSTQKVRTNDSTIKAAAPVAKKWNGDAKVIDHIDDTRRLAALRAALGPLVEPFEEAVLHGATLEEVGRGVGTNARSAAMASGKAVVWMGLNVVRGVLGELRREDIAA